MQPYEITNNPYFMTKTQTLDFHKQLMLSALKQGKYVVVYDITEETYIIISPLLNTGMSHNKKYTCTFADKVLHNCHKSENWSNNFIFNHGPDWKNDYTFHSIYTPTFEKPEFQYGDWVRIDMDEREITENCSPNMRAMINSGKAYQSKTSEFSNNSLGLDTGDRITFIKIDKDNLTKLTPEQAEYLNSQPEQKTRETITIGGVVYDKQEVENRLKDIKPVK